ncbi:NERD domain-containing protein [Neobacillus sp. SCS-31]|uniref:NERD domain-containing protein n=1 Tax=Neobacillus oceani TaxID=3115292 RepID=UPI003905AC07
MSFLKKTINILTMKRDIKEPIVCKDFNEREELFRRLEMLANSSDPTINSKKATNDLKLFSIGQAGEKSVFFELKNSLLPILILHDVNIEYEDYSAQIDFVVITHKFILILEVKKLFGNVRVTEKGEFQRVITKGNRTVSTEGMYSPLNQAERQAAILEKYLKSQKLINNCPIRFAVTFANPKTILDISKKAPAAVQTNVIRHDQIKTFLKEELEKESPVFMLDDVIYNLADFLLKNSNKKPFDVDVYKLAESISAEIPAFEPEPVKELEDIATIEARLKEFRLRRSREMNIKPFHIFTNKTLEALLNSRPTTIQELLLIEGIGPKKAEDFGPDILVILNGVYTPVKQ